MDGLIINQPYANLIINGQKSWELRSRPAPKSKIGFEIYLLSKGNILGKIKIQSSHGPINQKKLKDNIHLHRVSLDELDDSLILYVWEISISERFRVPKKYLHPNGARIWVRNVLLLDHHTKGKITTYI